MFEFIAVVVLANLIMLAVLYVLRHVIAIRAPVLLIAVGISILYCILYPFLMALVSYPQVLYLYVFLVVAGAGSLYVIESRLFTAGELRYDERPVAAGAMAYIPGPGVAQDMEPEAAGPSSGAEFTAEPVAADGFDEGQIAADEVAALLKAAAAGEPEGAEEAAACQAEDEITAAEEELEPGAEPVAADGVAEGQIAGDEVAELLKAAAAGEPEGAEEAAAYYAEDEITAAGEELEPGAEPVAADGVAEGQITADEVAELLKAAAAGEPEGAEEAAACHAEDEITAAGEELEPGAEPVAADGVAEGQIAGDEVAELLKAAAAGEPEGAEEAAACHAEDEITAAGEELEPEAEPVAADGVAEGQIAGDEVAELLKVAAAGEPEGAEEAAACHAEDEITAAGEELEPGAEPVAAESVDEGQITAGEVAELLRAAAAGELEDAEEDISFFTEDKIAAFEEGLEPADVQAEGVPDRNDFAADELMATLEGVDTADPVETMEESVFTGVPEKDSDISIEGFLSVKEESVLVYEEETSMPDEEWPGPESEIARMAIEMVEDIPDRDEATADEITSTLEVPDTGGQVEPNPAEETAAGDGEVYGDIAIKAPSLPGDDLNSLVATAFDKLASGDGAGAVDSFFRALKLDPPPKLALMLCTRISSIYSSQGLQRQALDVMEMLDVVWGPILDDSDRKGITTIIIQLRGEV